MDFLKVLVARIGQDPADFLTAEGINILFGILIAAYLILERPARVLWNWIERMLDLVAIWLTWLTQRAAPEELHGDLPKDITDVVTGWSPDRASTPREKLWLFVFFCSLSLYIAIVWTR